MEKVLERAVKTTPVTVDSSLADDTEGISMYHTCNTGRLHAQGKRPGRPPYAPPPIVHCTVQALPCRLAHGLPHSSQE